MELYLVVLFEITFFLLKCRREDQLLFCSEDVFADAIADFSRQAQK